MPPLARAGRGARGAAAVAVGAAGSLALLVVAGRHTPRALLLLMALWVLSPFALLVGARRLARAPLDTVAVGLAAVTIALYAVATFGPTRGRPAPTFVLVPPLSWVAVVAAAVAARRRGGTPA